MERLKAGTCVVLFALALVPATVALGGKVKPSEVKITGYDLGFFEGQVRSDFRLCQEKRRVELWEDNADVSDDLLGTEKTAASGGWSIVDTDGTGGNYYAVATHKEGKYRKKNGKKRPYDCPEVTSEIFVR